jgi:endonuclease/exonuclease/phosphatase family metal-dependent hydrolase
MTVEMISRRLALFISSIALLGTLAFSVPAARFFTSSPPEKKTLRVMTYNIHVGVGMDKKLDLQRIAEVKRTEGKDAITELAKLTAMNYAFAHNLDYQGGQYGVAILSRFPVKQIDHRKYENRREAERRGMIRVEIEFAGRTLNFVTTHLDYQFEDGRVFETEQLLKFLEGINGPLIVVGDFNEEPQGNAYKLILTGFEDAWIVAKMKEQGLSYPADRPVKRIDYIFTRRSDRLRVKRPRIISTAASDHLPLVADIQIR